MNPFNLNGPDFLFFYLTLILVLHFIVYIIRKFISSWDLPKVKMDDPYPIAYLSKGKEGVVRLCITKLFHEKKLLDSEENPSHIVSSKDASSKNKLEGTVLSFFKKPKTVNSLMNSTQIDTHLHSYEKQLTQLGLIPTDTQKRQIETAKYFFAFVLFIVSVYRITLSIQRGHYNIIFLVILTIVGILSLLWMHNQDKSLNAKYFLTHLQTTIRNSRNTSDNAAYFLAAASGLVILGLLAEDYKHLFPYQPASFGSSSHSPTYHYNCSSTSSCSSSGSSCGSSCSSGCGGCGGGGD